MDLSNTIKLKGPSEFRDEKKKLFGAFGFCLMIYGIFILGGSPAMVYHSLLIYHFHAHGHGHVAISTSINALTISA